MPSTSNEPPTPAADLEIFDEEFFRDMPSDFLNTLSVVPREVYDKQRQLLEEEERNATIVICESPVYQSYTTFMPIEDNTPLPPWENMFINMTGGRL
jgi:hypothetical protein